MTCFTALIIIQPSTVNVKSKVGELLLPYDSQTEVEPYKEYLASEELVEKINYLESLSQAEIDKIAKEWGVEANNLEILAKFELEWFPELIDGVDEKGEYRMITFNPNGKWDWYRFLDVESTASGLSIPLQLTVKEIPEFIPYAVVTPDGKWHELGEEAGLEAFVNREIKGIEVINEDEINWIEKVRQIKSDFQDYLAVRLYCHD